MTSDGDPTPDTIWQQRAVDRSLGPALAQAVSRSAAILAAARALLQETDGLDFTVQDIVDRSGLSMRSFYKHFGGKDELLLALMEELLREFAADLRAEVELVDDPVDRLEVYVREFHRRADMSTATGGRALGVYHVRMADSHREEFAAALAPQIEVLEEIVVLGAATGAFRDDLTASEVTALLMVTLMSTAQMRLLEVHLAGSPLGEDQLWAWCARAAGVPSSRIAPPDQGAAPTPAVAKKGANGRRPTAKSSANGQPRSRATRSRSASR
jgi:AcrR family transcriptional regulator